MIRPARMTATRSARPATAPRSWVISTSAMPRSRFSSASSAEDLGLDRDIQRGGRLVGDQQLRLGGERDGDHHALAHAAGELVRVLAQPLRGIAHVHALEQLQRCACAPRAASRRSGACAPRRAARRCAGAG